MPDKSVEDRTVVVTGSSRGIGKHIAEAFSRSGYNVVVCAPEFERDGIESTVDEINTQTESESAIGIACDVTDRETIHSLVDETMDRFGGIDVLINNAGGGYRAPFESISYEKWCEVVDLNLHGVFNCIQIIGEQIRDNSSGSIINIASQSGLHGNIQHTPYCAAKAGVISLTKTLAFEWAADNVRINAIAPGLVATPLTIEQDDSEAEITGGENVDRDNACRRVGHPDEIADVAVFLASTQASYVNGETISAAGVPRLERMLEVQRYEPGESAWLDAN